MTTEGPVEAKLPDLDAVRAAARRLAGRAVMTPLLESPVLNAKLGGRLLVKAEVLQRTGSFKFRGAFNRISQIPESERRYGVVAFSSGNHAQGVAAAAQLFEMPAVIVMPADAPKIKVANTRGYGAEIVFYDRYKDNREVVAEKIIAERGATLVRPYDDAAVIAGQGTSGLELAEQAAERGIVLDAVAAPCSGGGLISGIALVVSALSPSTAVHTAEPEGFDDAARSLAAGRRQKNAGGGKSICDALMAEQPGELTFAAMRGRVASGFAVSEAEVAQAMGAAFEYFKLVVEPGGAVALAAALSGKLPVKGRTVAVVCSGGNVDAALFRRVLADAAA
ncbi:MAG TPA: threonine/serine dehydratase [Alphaproteobacteria bacterium]|nr:threonine/serine dehydratase [Alphaproteobacteria bacterium]